MECRIIWFTKYKCVRRMYELIKCEIPSKEVREGFVNAPDSLMIDKLMSGELC